MFTDFTGTPLSEAPPICLYAGMKPEDWPFEISMEAAQLFETMPATFTFDELTNLATEQALSSPESVACLREWEQLGMITFDGQRFHKTGQKPYF